MWAAAPAPSAEGGALGDAHSFVVNRTFINVLEPSVHEEPLRIRSSSDSALYESGKKIEFESKEGEVDFDLVGLSDTETLDGLEDDAGLTCYSALRDTSAQAYALAAPMAANSTNGSEAAGKLSAAPQNACDSGSLLSATVQENGTWTMAALMSPEVHVAAMPAGSPGTPARSDGGVSPALSKCLPDETHQRWGSDELVEDDQRRTTVMLRNLPNNYTRAMLLGLLDQEGFAGLYDFLYLPIDFRSRSCLGYAFVNLVDPAVVPRFWKAFDGYSKWILPSKKSCYVSWSGPHQGLEANIERWRNSPVMHSSVADECKPLIFCAGARVGFPAPTKSTRPPRLRNSAQKGGCPAASATPWAARSRQRTRAVDGDAAELSNAEAADCDVAAQSPTTSLSPPTRGEEDTRQWLVSENMRLQMENQLLRQQQYTCQSGWGAEDPTMYAQTQDGMWVMQWPVSVIAMPVCVQAVPESVEALQPAAAPQQAHQKKPLQEKRDRGAVAGRAAASSPRSGAAVAKATPTPRWSEIDEDVTPEPEPELSADEHTTVMLRNLPNNYSRAQLLRMLDSEGFAGKYDFVYLPIDFKSQACLGYAFVNMVDPSVVQPFWKAFDGYSKWVVPSKKVGHVSWSGPHQGLEAHVERYRNSPVMHSSVLDECKPMLFKDGVRVAFPEPTKSTRAPRLRQAVPKVARQQPKPFALAPCRPGSGRGPVALEG